jgi:type I restriction enzyme S subunit
MKELKISEFADVVTGGTPSTSVKEYWENGNIPWLNSGELNKGYIYNAENFITEAGLKSSSTKMMPADTVLIALTGATCGLSAISKIEACANQSVTGILPSKNHVPEYLFYYLRTQRQRILDKAWGNAQPHISQAFVKEFKVPLPPLSDQLHIANLLSKAENLIAQRKESICLLDEYLKSTFLEMFGDPEKNPKNLPFTELEKLCAVIVDCPHSTPVKSEEATNFPCIRTSELTNGYISWDSMQYLEEDEYKKRTQRLIPEVGDIVYSREGTYGEAIRIPATHKFSLGQRTMLFRPDYKKTNSIFLWAMVRSEFVYRQAKKKNSGSTVGHVNVKDIKQFRVYNPPIELQNQFAQIIEKTEAIKTQYQQSLQELENLYGSLSQKAFKGELSIKDESLLMAAEPNIEYKTL